MKAKTIYTWLLFVSLLNFLSPVIVDPITHYIHSQALNASYLYLHGIILFIGGPILILWTLLKGEKAINKDYFGEDY